MPRRRTATKSWARPALVAIALLGTLLTAYLTLIKLTGGEAICPTAGCATVLNSRYGEVLGLPLALFGCGAYGLTGLMAGLPLLGRGEIPKGQESDWEKRTWMPLFLVTTAMVMISGYLIYLLLTQLQVFCLYCWVSALLTLAMWLVVLLGRSWEDIGGLVFNASLVTVAVLGFVLASNPSLAGQAVGETPAETAAAPSSPAAIALAQHLSASGALMYGAYWCPHCQDQKKRFGAAGAAALPYVECDASAKNGDPEKCRAAGIDGFPTWKIGDQTLSGNQDLETLAEASGYKGSRDF